jgi:hypothetical protein
MLIVSAHPGGPMGVAIVAKWDAREWVAGHLGLDPGEVAVRSIDRYGESETQVRYEHAGVVVARLTVTGPIRHFMRTDAEGHWELKAQIGSGTQDVHLTEVPESDEIVYE